MRRNTCAVFDIDDTLYLESDYVRSGFEAVGRWAVQCMEIDDFGERCWRRFAAGRRRSIFNEVLSEAGRQVDPDLISALVEIYRTHRPSIELALDAYKALEEISRIASIAIISDGPLSSQSRKAEALGLESFAAPIILTEMFGQQFAKPHPRAFELVNQRCPASEYVYIADNPMKDFTAPKLLGWRTVRVRRPGGLHCAIELPGVIPDREMADCSRLIEFFTQR